MRSLHKNPLPAVFSRFLLVSATIFSLCELRAGEATAPAPASQPGGSIQGGLHLVDGQPFYKRAAWWGCNHWMTGEPDKSLGSLLSLPENLVGTDRDFYTRAQFNTVYFSWVADDVERNIHWLKQCIARCKKTGMKIVLHPNTGAQEKFRKDRNWTLVTEEGEAKPIPNNLFHYDAKEHAAGVRERLKPMIDLIRNEPGVIGYQIGGETWAAISYDEQSIARFREFVKKDFSLEQVSERYGGDKAFYKSWDDVFPPIKGGAADFKKRTLPNGKVAHYDWARYNKKVHEDAWVGLVDTINDLDGTGRPISYEYNHGPFSGQAYGLYNFEFAAIAARVKNFSVGGGEFSYSLPEAMHTLYIKSVGEGPWFTNEVGAGSGIVPWSGRPAYLRRQLWWNAALGFDGFNIWTFFNILGANSEFVPGRNYDPIVVENLPAVFFEVEHTNRMMNSLGGLLAESKASKPRIGILYLEDSTLSGHVGSYKTDAFSLLRALAAHGLADQVAILTEYQVDHDKLGGLQAILLPTTPRITADHARKLADFVSAGGTLLMMGNTAEADDLFKVSPVFPAGPLAKVAGIEAGKLAGEELHNAPVSIPWGKKTVFIDVTTRLKIPPGSSAKAVVSSGTQPVVTMQAFGKGRCIFLAGKPLVVCDNDATGELLAGLLREGGIKPAAAITGADGAADTGIFAGRRIGPHGSLLLAIETEDRAHDFRVTLDPVALGFKPGETANVFECFSNETHPVSAQNNWSFTSRIEPIGVRSFFVTKETSLEKFIPKDRQIIIDRADPDQFLASRTTSMGGQVWGDGRADYTAAQMLSGESEKIKSETVTAADAKAGLPRDLGDGYAGLDLDGYCNQPLRSLLKDVSYAEERLFGGNVQTKDAGNSESLPLKQGCNKLGDVPTWVNGRFIKLGPRLLQGIPVGGKIQSLHFFHQAILWTHDSVLGYYRVNYADGTSLRVPIAVFSTLTDQTRPWGIAPKTTIVWTTAKKDNRLSRYDWVNPFPEKAVTSLDVVRDETGTFSLWAITAKAKPGGLIGFTRPK